MSVDYTEMTIEFNGKILHLTWDGNDLTVQNNNDNRQAVVTSVNDSDISYFSGNANIRFLDLYKRG